MVASKEIENPFFRGIGLQRWSGFGALAQVFGRTAILFLRRYIDPALKCVSADLLELAVPEIAEINIGRKNFKTAAQNLGRQTLL